MRPRFTRVPHPAEVPRAIAKAVDAATRQFAETEGLELKDWYHDEPLWILRWPDAEWPEQVQILQADGLWCLEVHGAWADAQPDHHWLSEHVPPLPATLRRALAAGAPKP